MILLYDNVNAKWMALDKVETQLRENEVDILQAVSVIILPVSQLKKLHEADKAPTSNLPARYCKETFERVKNLPPLWNIVILIFHCLNS